MQRDNSLAVELYKQRFIELIIRVEEWRMWFHNDVCDFIIKQNLVK